MQFTRIAVPGVLVGRPRGLMDGDLYEEGAKLSSGRCNSQARLARFEGRSGRSDPLEQTAAHPFGHRCGDEVLLPE